MTGVGGEEGGGRGLWGRGESEGVYGEEGRVTGVGGEGDRGWRGRGEEDRD